MARGFQILRSDMPYSTPPDPPATPRYGTGTARTMIQNPDGTWTVLEGYGDNTEISFELIGEDKCECGAFKTSKAKRHDPSHSSWCPWAKK